MSKKTTTVTKEVAVDEHDSPAVLAYRVGRLEITQAERFNSLEAKLDNITTGFVTTAQLLAAQTRADDKHREQDRAIRALESWNTWAARIVIGAVLTAVMALLLKGNGVF